MSNKVKRLAYITVGITWCLVGAQVVVGGVSLIVTGGKKK